MEDVKTTQQERFKYMREEIINLSQQKLADKLGIKQQSIADIESGRKQKIDTDILYKLLDEYVINTEWLLFGTGLPTKVDDLEHLCRMQPDNLVSVPFYSAKVAAGFGNEFPDYEEKDVIHFDKRWLTNILGVNPENAVILQVEGDSMDSGMNKSNDIKDGDLLLVDVSVKDVINNKVFVIQQDNKLRVKRVKQKMNGDLYLISNNEKEYPPELVKQESTIIGKVVWNCSKENI